MDQPSQRARETAALLGVCMFASGASSLGLELVWSAQLGVVLGGTTASIAFVVALFMGGMAIGYAVGGRIAPLLQRPVAAYGATEIVLALCALLVTHLAPRLEATGSLPLSYLLAGLLLLPCTFLAGLSLPLLIDGTRGSVGARLGWLYSATTFGAAYGAIVTGMFLIGALGLRGSAEVLACLGILVGSLALGFGWKLPARSRARQSEAPVVRVTDAAPTSQGYPFRWAALGLGVGFASLAEQVLWTRALIPQLNSSTYAFSAVLAVLLFGLAVGALLSGRLLARGADPIIWLCTTQLAAGLLVLFSPQALTLAEHCFPGYVGLRLVSDISAWASVVWTVLSRANLALFLPTCMLGFALPLLAELCGRSIASRSRAVGMLAGWNTLGAVAGSIAARFALLPVLGVSGSLRALAVVHAVLALFCIVGHAGKLGVAAMSMALALLSLLHPNAAPFLGRMAQGHKLLLVDEGVQDTTAVVELAGAAGVRQIISNGIAYAGDTEEAKRYRRMLAHLPALQAREQRRALVICLGTGMTAAAVARHPAFESLDLVDISPVVFRTLPLFARANDRVYADPRARIHIEDGRVFLARAPTGYYDVITLEPPPPRVAGAAALYSREFYASAKRALADGGALAQWLPAHDMTNDELRMLARTFVRVFPEGILYEVQHGGAALIGQKGPGADAQTVARRMAQLGVAEHLRGISVPAPLELPNIRGAALRKAIGGGSIVTDDLPHVEHFAARLPEHGGSTHEAGQGFLNRMLGSQRKRVAPN